MIIGKGRDDILIIDDLKNGANYKNLRGLHFIDYLQQG